METLRGIERDWWMMNVEDYEQYTILQRFMYYLPSESTPHSDFNIQTDITDYRNAIASKKERLKINLQ